MLESDPHKGSLPARAVALYPLQGMFLGLAFAMAIMLALSVVATFGISAAALLSLVVFTTVAVVATYALPLGHPHKTLGSANVITLARGGFAAFVAGAILMPDMAPWVVFAVAAVALALDGVDGALARYEGRSSDFGARFDMEVDAVLAATLSLVLLTSGKAGSEILILGFMRYGFVLASYLWPWLDGPLPESFRRKAVCVLQIGTLIVLLCPLTPLAWLTPLAAVAVLALVWSFAVDILWLRRAVA